MQAFTVMESRVVPLDRANVDTDALVPKQFMKTIRRTGLGEHLFDAWRYLDPGEPGKPRETRVPNPDFCLNQPHYAGAGILLARDNFGCGSSREHACWALADYGIRALIAPSFADIFFNNCFKNGLLPIVLDRHQVDHLFELAGGPQALSLRIDLPNQLIQALPDGQALPFEIDAYRKHCLVHALDDVGITLQSSEQIKAYETARKQFEPWLFD